MRIKHLALLIALFSVSILSLSAQQTKYRRSSLSMLLIESDNFPSKEAVMKSWNAYPFPDKYNKHDIGMSTLSLAKEASSDTAGAEEEKFKGKIDRVIKEKKLANKLVAKWFNRDASGKFNMNLIQERGFYSASEMEASVAKGQARGLSSLGDAGEELIKNTFVTFTKLDFIENEPAARAIRDAAQIETQKRLEGKPQFLIDKALQALEVVYEKTKEGYSLWSKTWLYRLNWNDSIAAVFYTDLWSNPAAFENSDLFSLEFVGVQYNQSLVTFKIGETRTQEQIIDLGLVRNIDNVFAKLQKKNEVFRPKVPVLGTDPVTAQIGMKEGLEGGEKFDVLEMTLNEKSGRTEYKKVASVSVDKKGIWDNRYNAGSKPEVETLDKDGKPIVATRFKGGKKVQTGMLLKQAK